MPPIDAARKIGSISCFSWSVAMKLMPKEIWVGCFEALGPGGWVALSCGDSHCPHRTMVKIGGVLWGQSLSPQDSGQNWECPVGTIIVPTGQWSKLWVSCGDSHCPHRTILKIAAKKCEFSNICNAIHPMALETHGIDSVLRAEFAFGIWKTRRGAFSRNNLRFRLRRCLWDGVWPVRVSME